MQSKPSNLVTIDNKLAQASYSLNMSEQRLLFIILSKIRPDYYRKETTQETNDKVFLDKVITKEDLFIQGETVDCTTLYQLSVREYADFCSIDIGDARHELIGAAEHLFNRRITLKEGTNSFCSFGWVQWIRYDEVTDTIGLRWSFGILPYIQNLTKYFTKLKLNSLLGLKSTYSWKLYQLLVSKKGENIYKRNVEIDIESILFSLDVPISCREFKFFNSKILQKSMKEIVSQKLLEELSVEKILKGKKVTGLSFSWLNQEEVDKKRLAKANLSKGVTKDA
jgi:plasmid replication initiation protein